MEYREEKAEGNSGKKGSGSLRLISFMEIGKAGWEISIEEQ
jgi:hypothetical protein